MPNALVLGMARCLPPEPLELRPPVGSAQQPGLVVEHDVDGNVLQRLAHAPLGDKALHKAAVAQFVEDLGRDATADEYPPRRHQFEGEVARLATVEIDVEV